MFTASAQVEKVDAQKFNVRWKKRKVFQIPETYMQYHAIICKDKEVVTFKVSSAGYLNRTKKIHKIIHINSQAGVDRFNKIYIPTPQGAIIRGFKARVILPNGKRNKLKFKHLKKVDEIGKERDLLVGVFEGVEVGSEIEYTYSIVERKVSAYGRRAFDKKLPAIWTDFEIRGIGIITASSTLLQGDNIHSYRSNNRYTISNYIPLKEESYSLGDGQDPHINYYAYSIYRKGSDESVFKKFKANIANNLSWDGEAIYNKWIENIDFSGAENVMDSIFFIENHFKTTYTISGKYESCDDEVQFINDKKGTASNAANFLFRGLEHFIKIKNDEHPEDDEIDLKLLITSSRFDEVFDPNFPSPYVLNDYIIKINDQYIVPADGRFRLGLLPYWYADNHALIVMGSSELIVFQENSKQKESQIVMDFDFRINSNLQACMVKGKMEYTGFRSLFKRSSLMYADVTEKDRTLKGNVDWLSDGIVVKDISVVNDHVKDNYNNKPFSITTTYSNPNLIEKAGEEIILKVGASIGNQEEMFQESERVNDIHIKYPVEYSYELRFHIPKGYDIIGEEKLNIDNSVIVKDEKIARFKSSYELKNGVLTIFVNEFYKNTRYKQEDFKSYQNVINSAANFNNLSVLLKKIK